MFQSSAPARVCLYGEHQDYLQLKVIPAAINLRLIIESKLTNTNKLSVFSQDFNKKLILSNNPKQISSEKGTLGAYLEAGMLALRNLDNDIIFPSLDVSIKSEIPIASGLSSSAALLVSWIKHLDGILKLKLDKRNIAELAYDAEHNILNIPCGKMDQYASSYGNLICLTCTEPPQLKILENLKVGMIVVDSQTPKFTSEIHSTKVNKIKKAVSTFEKTLKLSIVDSSLDLLEKHSNQFSSQELKIIQGVLIIKEDTLKAEEELMKPSPNLEFLGKLLTSQQKALREDLSVSLETLDKIVDTGIKHGALGGKLTGAGLGGSVVLLADKDVEVLAEKIRKELKLPTRTVKISDGALFSIQNN